MHGVIVIIVANDLGKFNSMVCFYETHKQPCRFQLVKKERGYLNSLLKDEPVDLVVMKACSCSGWVNDLCQSLDHQPLVCSTVRRRGGGETSNEKRQGRCPETGQARGRQSTSPAPHSRPCTCESRKLVKYRKQLVGQANRINNFTQSLFLH